MNPVRLFISYAHEDEAFKDALVRHLRGLERLGMVDTWDDRKIAPGQEWDSEIKNSLENADIVVFLVSSYFMNSDYILDVEIKETIQREKAGQQTIVPVITRPCDFESLVLHKFQALPNHALAVTRWDDEEEAWYNVTLGIKSIIYKLRGEGMPGVEKSDISTTEKASQTEKEASPSKLILHDFHQYTCNRRAQFSRFVETSEQKKDKVQFYYVLGEEQESHFGLVNRLAYEKGGHLLDIENPSPQTSRLVINDILLENLSGLAHLKMRLIRELFARLNIAANNCEPILQKNLGFVCEASPELKNMNDRDYVSILFSIYEDEWDEEEIPQLIQWFVLEFCNAKLPEQAPNFIFFFGIIYDERDPEIIESIQEAVQESSLIKEGRISPLPELEVVGKKDITRWFRKYKIIAPDSEVREAFMQKHFPKVDALKMETVQIELKKIIDQFNHPT